MSNEGSIVDLAIEHGILKKSGSWISYNDEKLGQGRDRVVNLLREDAELREELTDKVLQAMKGVVGEGTEE